MVSGLIQSVLHRSLAGGINMQNPTQRRVSLLGQPMSGDLLHKRLCQRQLLCLGKNAPGKDLPRFPVAPLLQREAVKSPGQRLWAIFPLHNLPQQRASRVGVAPAVQLAFRHPNQPAIPPLDGFR